MTLTIEILLAAAAIIIFGYEAWKSKSLIALGLERDGHHGQQFHLSTSGTRKKTVSTRQRLPVGHHLRVREMG